jgi:hypothetical protein
MAESASGVASVIAVMQDWMVDGLMIMVELFLGWQATNRVAIPMRKKDGFIEYHIFRKITIIFANMKIYR